MNWQFFAWGVGIGLAAIFGVLIFFVCISSDPRRRRIAGLWRDFLATVRKPRPSPFPIEFDLTSEEISALHASRITIPLNRLKRRHGSDIQTLPLARHELQEFYALVMQDAQARISRAAWRAREGRGGALTGAAFIMGALAGRLHQTMLEEFGSLRADTEPKPPPVDILEGSPQNSR